MLRKLTFALIMVLAVALVAGAAVARPAHRIDCKGKYPCVGTPRGDTTFGTKGYDHISGGPGRDTITGDKDNDRIFTRDGQHDDIYCGLCGRDRVRADYQDYTWNCEDVARR